MTANIETLKARTRAEMPSEMRVVGEDEGPASLLFLIAYDGVDAVVSYTYWNTERDGVDIHQKVFAAKTCPLHVRHLIRRWLYDIREGLGAGYIEEKE